MGQSLRDISKCPGNVGHLLIVYDRMAGGGRRNGCWTF